MAKTLKNRISNAKLAKSLGFDVDGLMRRKKLAMDHVHIKRAKEPGHVPF